jgi:hypothetical protein
MNQRVGKSAEFIFKSFLSGYNTNSTMNAGMTSNMMSPVSRNQKQFPYIV